MCSTVGPLLTHRYKKFIATVPNFHRSCARFTFNPHGRRPGVQRSIYRILAMRNIVAYKDVTVSSVKVVRKLRCACRRMCGTQAGRVKTGVTRVAVNAGGPALNGSIHFTCHASSRLGATWHAPPLRACEVRNASAAPRRDSFFFFIIQRNFITSRDTCHGRGWRALAPSKRQRATGCRTVRQYALSLFLRCKSLYFPPHSRGPDFNQAPREVVATLFLPDQHCLHVARCSWWTREPAVAGQNAFDSPNFSLAAVISRYWTFKCLILETSQ